MTANQSRGFCVIMAGGRGTRFWPLSRTDRPKQLLPLASARSLLRETFDRVEPLVGADRVLVVTSGDLAGPIAAELPELPAERIVAEPVGRNTAPCSILGAGLAARLAPGAPLALLPADHAVPDSEIFRTQLAAAFTRAAAVRGVITLGIPPTRPETGYGYLEIGAASADQADLCAGVAFVEKPDVARAESYLAGGRHLWNSGIFVWDAGALHAAATRHVPDIVACLAPAVAAWGTAGFPTALSAAYSRCPAVSIDYGIMERLSAFEVMRARFRWSDLGSWRAWGELAPELGGGNRGLAELLSIDSQGNVIHVRDKLVALVEVSDLVVVDTGDALLICRATSDQRVKEIIDRLAREGRQQFL